MKVMCAWCKKEISVASAPTVVDGNTSHNLCLLCADSLNFQDGVNMQRYIESLPNPIAVLDERGRVVTVNRNVLSFVHKDLTMVKGQYGGEVFECQYARLPEGCGRTIHCSGCTIRMCVTETFRTGKPVFQRKALLSQDVSSKYYLLISTRKVNDTVLLMIEQMNRCLS